MQNERITQDQYDSAVKELCFHEAKQLQKTSKKRGPNKLSIDEKKRRKALKEIVKWVFDVELDRSVTPLYCQSGSSSECINQLVFISMASKVIRYCKFHPVIAATKSKKELMDSIEEVVKNRRRNLKSNKRMAAKNPGHKTLKLAYYKKNSMTVCGEDGEDVSIPVPRPLPLDEEPSDDDDENVNQETTNVSSSPVYDADAKSTALRKVQDAKIAELQRQLVLLQNQREKLASKPVVTVADVSTREKLAPKPVVTTADVIAPEKVVLKPVTVTTVDAVSQLPLKRQTQVVSKQPSNVRKKRRKHLSFFSRRQVDSLELSPAKPASFCRSELTSELTWLQRLSNKSNTKVTGTIICNQCRTECDKKSAKPPRK